MTPFRYDRVNPSNSLSLVYLRFIIWHKLCDDDFKYVQIFVCMERNLVCGFLPGNVDAYSTIESTFVELRRDFEVVAVRADFARKSGVGDEAVCCYEVDTSPSTSFYLKLRCYFCT